MMIFCEERFKLPDCGILTFSNIQCNCLEVSKEVK